MSTAESIIRYIVVQRLANNEEFFCVLQHVVQGYSPSTIAKICNVTKNTARAYIYKISEKTNSLRAMIIAKHALPLVLQHVPTAVTKTNGRAICILCNSGAGDLPQNHISLKHPDTVNHYTDLVVSKLREKFLYTAKKES